MAIPKQLVVINDFSSGEVDVDLKRGGDSPSASGGRQMANWRVLNSKKKANRPGRSALFLESGRVDEILMSPGNKFFLAFGNGYLKVYNAAGAQVFSTALRGDGSPIPWTTPSLGNIVWALSAGTQKSVYIAYLDSFPSNTPQVLTWDGVSQTSSWSIANYAEAVLAGGQKRTIFYRLSPQNVTMLPSGTTGNISITFSAPVLVAGMVGTRMTWAGRQILITGITDSQHGSATVIEPLPTAQQLTLTGSAGNFGIGDEVIGANTGATGIVISGPGSQVITYNSGAGGAGTPLTGALPTLGQVVTGGTSGATGTVTDTSRIFDGSNTIFGPLGVSLNTSTQFVNGEATSWSGGSSAASANMTVGGANLIVQVIQKSSGNIAFFAVGETVAGPSGYGTIATGGVAAVAPQAISIWQDEVMNSFRGFPASVFFDQGRLGFCNFFALPSAIAWSAIGFYTDLFTDASNAANSFTEIAPGKSQVFYVQPGMESSEFVFCDNAVYYIPILPTLPLEPGSVSFQKLSEEGCIQVQPRPAEQTILYMKAGGLQVGAVQAPGAYYRPYVIDVVAEFHTHLFTSSPPVTIAVPAASAQFQELYAYILLANGTVLNGHYSVRQGLLDVGPEGKPKIGWLPWNGGGTVKWVSALGSSVVFTTSYAPNSVPAVSVVEQLDNTRFLDGALFVNNLPAPFTPPSGKGPLFEFPGPNSTVYLIDLGTRFMGIYNVDPNGWIIPQNQDGENLASTQLVAGQPWTAVFEPFIPDAGSGQDARQRTRRRKIVRAAVTVENSTGFVYAASRVPAYFVGDDPTQPAPLRENTYRFRYPGRFFDPRVVLQKDTPGSLTVLEHAVETTV